MLSAMFTGMIITHYETVLSTSTYGVMLTACIPMLMDTGGNCGAQASTLAIRGLALGEIELKDIFRILWKEIRVALLLGAVLAAVNVLRLYFLSRYGMEVSLIVSAAMFLTVILAKAVGASLPLLVKAAHLDPALMASPLLTTMVDACSLWILFSIATKALAL